MTTKILPVILSGGFGTRLWPLSRKQSPKQFLKIQNNGSLFSKALNLVSSDKFLPPMIISNESHKFFCLDETTHFSKLILEPVGRNTAMSIALASIEAKKLYGEDTVLLVMPSDHLISEKAQFLKSVESALELAETNIVLFGIKPTYPATGYGYIETSGTDVVRFREKPNKETAEGFIQSGNFFWNSGIFCFSAGNMLESLAKLAPGTLKIANTSIEKAKVEDNILTLPKDPFEKADDISFDYAILEKSSNISCTPMLSPWSDVGDFGSFLENIETESKNTEMLDCINTSVISKKLVACIGLPGIVIVDTPDALLVANKEKLQDIKKIVQRLEEKGANEVLFANKVFRPWGSYEVLLETPTHKVKQIVVKPQSKLSLQSHNRRAEHWVIVSGTATITRNEEEITLKAGEAVDIPLGAKHRLTNNTNEPVIVIETQMGDYLGEDDIIRYSDVYGR